MRSIQNLPRVQRYAFALAMVALGTAMRIALGDSIGAHAPFAIYYLAIFFAAWIGGPGPGLAAASAAILTTLYFFTPAVRELAIPDEPTLLELGFYYAIGCALALASSALRHAQLTVTEQREWYSTTLDSVADGVIATDVQGRITYLNSAAEDLTGWFGHRARGRPLREVLGVDDGDLPLDAHASVDGSAAPPTHELQFVGPESTRRARVVTAPIHTRRGLLGFVSVLHDVTAAKTAEIEREAQELRLREQRALTRAVINGVPAFLAYFDTDGHHRLHNRFYDNWFGGRAIEGRSLRELVGERAWPTIEPNFQRACAGARVDADATMLDASGAERVFHLTYMPHYGEHSEVCGVVLHAYDITRLRDDERRIEAEERRFRSLVEASAAIVWRVGADGGPIVAPGWQALTGQPPDALATAGWLDAVHADDRYRMLALATEARQRAESMEVELRVRTWSGAYRTVAVRGVPILDDERRVVEWIGTVRDVHDRREAEERLAASLRQMRLILDASPARIAYLDTDLAVVWANRVFQEWNCVDDFVGRRLDALMRPKQFRLVAASLARALEGKHEQLEWSYPDSLLGERWTLTSISPDYDDAGLVRGCIMLCMDITAWRHAEAALDQREREQRTLLENVPDMVWIIDDDGIGRPYNRAWNDYTGLAAGSDWRAPAHPEDRAAVDAAWQNAQRSGGALSVEARYRRADDEYRWHLLRFRPLLDGNGTIERWYGSFTDIEDQKQAQATLRTAQERMSEFIAVLSHELRNPLAAISAALHLLSHPKASPEAVERARQTLSRQTEQLTRMVDDLLDVARVSRGKIDLQRERVDVNELLREVCADMTSRAKERGTALECEPGSTPVFVNVDVLRIKQAVENLIVNALQACSNGGDVVVRCVPTPGTREVCVRVEDSGRGIAPDQLEHLFDPFVRGDRPSGEGLGLGLSIVRRIVELHDGRVDASSLGAGHGARFDIVLPLSTAGAAFARAPERGSTTLLRGERVLVVEDDIAGADTIRALLELQGADVRVAANGLEGVDVARAWLPTIVLSDIGLPPPLTGYDVARQLNELPPIARPYLIAYSGYGQPADVAAAHSAGFMRHLTKPASAESLVNAIRQGVEVRRATAPST